MMIKHLKKVDYCVIVVTLRVNFIWVLIMIILHLKILVRNLSRHLIVYHMLNEISFLILISYVLNVLLVITWILQMDALQELLYQINARFMKLIVTNVEHVLMDTS